MGVQSTLDPVASMWQDYYNFDGTLGRRKDGWYKDMFQAGFEGEHLLGETLVLPQIELAGTAAGIAEAEEVHDAGHGGIAADVVAEGLHEVEHKVRLAPGESGS